MISDNVKHEGTRPVLRRKGLTRGLRRARWGVMAGIDADPTTAETYRRNNPETRFVAADRRFVADHDIRRLAGTTPSPELLLAGCTPCQLFSKQRRQGSTDDRSAAEDPKNDPATPRDGPCRSF